jgi:hypothetical protein
MSILEGILESVFGRVHFVITVGNKPAIEIKLEGKDIVVDIRNPVLAMEIGLEEFLSKRKANNQASLIKMIKSKGYTIKIKYKFLEIDF